MGGFRVNESRSWVPKYWRRHLSPSNDRSRPFFDGEIWERRGEEAYVLAIVRGTGIAMLICTAATDSMDLCRQTGTPLWQS